MSKLFGFLSVLFPKNTLNFWTYLLAVCLFSISFLVFINAAASFVVTDLIGLKDEVGSLVGTLGFVDELVALAACPFWGILSDRIGVRHVCVAGYIIVGLSLFIFVQARNFYPQLLIARAFFSIGGAATATMVTSILPSISENDYKNISGTASDVVIQSENLSTDVPQSADSQITITPLNYNSSLNLRRNNQTSVNSRNETENKPLASPPRIAGLVGLFTGSGAIIALILFLPLPAQFSKFNGITQGQAIKYSFYVVGTISLAVACVCFFGLRGLVGEGDKGWFSIHRNVSSTQSSQRLLSDQYISERLASGEFSSYWRMLVDSLALGLKDSQIGLAYLGGFVARASSVAISLFIPTYVNAFFIQNGFCNISPSDPPSELKKGCRAAYILAAELTGVSQLVALLFTPVFGYFSDRYRRFNFPLLIASIFGIIGYTGFARLTSPEPKNIDERGGGPSVFILVSLIGISQIGAIVCSLGLLGSGILDGACDHTRYTQQFQTHIGTSESLPLIPSFPNKRSQRTKIKGSIAGVYSLFGGVAILILTKLGGYLFDKSSRGAPFYIMAIFNCLLFLAGIGTGLCREFQMRV